MKSYKKGVRCYSTKSRVISLFRLGDILLIVSLSLSQLSVSLKFINQRP